MRRVDRPASVTIRDVAAAAGVSAGTVSRVMNGASVPLPTRRRVNAAITKLGYVPNFAARSLKRRASEQVALVVPDVANPVYVQMAKAIQRVAASRGYQLSLLSTDNGVHDERDVLRALQMRQLDGMILVSLRPGASLLEQIRGASDRLCLIGSFPEDLPTDAVRVDSAKGIELGIGHLIEQGRQRIAFVNGTPGTVPADRRAQGYRDGLLRRGIPYDHRLVAHAGFTMEGGYRAVAELLALDPPVDAFLCANDLMAVGVLRRLREAGCAVPLDCAVVGMDDIDFAAMTTPTLTTISLRAQERGRIAIEMLLERINHKGSPPPPRTVLVAPRLVVRESTTTLGGS